MAKSQATLSQQKQDAIARAIAANPDVTCAGVAKKAKLKIAQVACSGLWRQHLANRSGDRPRSLARGPKVAVGKMSTGKLLSKSTNNSHATVAELESALYGALEVVKSLREKLESESDRNATALKDLVGGLR
jgi:outer membrane protein TolC